MTPIIVEGRFVSPTQIELAQPVHVTDAAVQIEIRTRPVTPSREAALALLERMAAYPSRGRSAADIQKQIDEDRSEWDQRR